MITRPANLKNSNKTEADPWKAMTSTDPAVMMIRDGDQEMRVNLLKIVARYERCSKKFG